MTDAARAPRRPPKRDRTRSALVRAGQKLYSERPIDAVSVDDIVQAADVAKGTFYNHFVDKEAFEGEIQVEARRELQQAIEQAIDGQDDPALRTALATCVGLRFAHDHPDRARLLLRWLISGQYLTGAENAGLVHDVSRAILSGRFLVPTTELGVMVILGLGTVALARALELTDLASKVALGQTIAATILRTLGLERDEAERLAAGAADRAIRSGG